MSKTALPPPDRKLHNVQTARCRDPVNDLVQLTRADVGRSLTLYAGKMVRPTETHALQTAPTLVWLQWGDVSPVPSLQIQVGSCTKPLQLSAHPSRQCTNIFRGVVLHFQANIGILYPCTGYFCISPYATLTPPPLPPRARARARTSTTSSQNILKPAVLAQGVSKTHPQSHPQSLPPIPLHLYVRMSSFCQLW
jgi:hypothetical protein